MTRLRSRLLTTIGYAILLMVAAGTVGSVSAAGTRPDVMGYDDISTSCTGGQNYYFQNSYENLWNSAGTTGSRAFARPQPQRMRGGTSTLTMKETCSTSRRTAVIGI